jgi:GTPase SAR1 family protein
VRAVLERLRYEPALVIVGDSGVGKSSLCRAATAMRASVR